VVGERRRLDGVVEHHLLRVGQEAMTNAVKHSGCTKIDLELRYERGATTLVVSDNGHGLPEQPDSPTRHFGLRGMKERAQHIGATLAVDDSREGVRVTIRVPTPERAA
jgi:signal transduction histidine kinase